MKWLPKYESAPIVNAQLMTHKFNLGRMKGELTSYFAKNAIVTTQVVWLMMEVQILNRKNYLSF